MYTSEKHTRILIALMKEHGIKKVVASPGTTNICLVGSLQNDPYFELFSSVDERSAGFIAVGMAAESGEPVALSCTGSTASRNYIPALTEAFYRQLPILAITASQSLARVGQNFSQVIDRSSPLADMVKESVTLDVIHTPDEEWQCVRDTNKALIALRKNGGGPVHINLVTTYSRDFSSSLPSVRVIRHIGGHINSEMPSLEKYKRITIFVGCHAKWSEELFREVEKFCETHNAVVSASHSGNYKGDYDYNPALVLGQREYVSEVQPSDLAIYIGTIPRYSSGTCEREMWRVNPDGLIRDFDKRLTKVFQMREADFFRYYNEKATATATPKYSPHRHCSYALELQKEYEGILAKTSEIPFSNVWVARQTLPKLPKGCVLHLAGSNTARAWNFFPLPKSIDCYTNDGTMGIDGQVSALVGASLSNPFRLHIGVVGDLTFFYDMNSIGNRHIQPNFRLMVINNGMGAEFKIYTHPASVFGEKADNYMAGSGHFGKQSRNLLRHYVEDLGYEYLTADSKESFINILPLFTEPEMKEQPVIFEVFTDSSKENEAIYTMNHLASNMKGKAKDTAVQLVRKIAGERGIMKAKSLLGR